MKKMFSLVALLLVVPFATHAAVSFDGAVLVEDTVIEGADVTVEVEYTKSGSGCDNNVGRVEVTVDGTTYTESINSFTGSGTATSSVEFPAPGTPGDYDVFVELFTGEEDFSPADGTPDCSDASLGDDTLQLHVEAKPAPSNDDDNERTTSYGGILPCGILGGGAWCSSDPAIKQFVKNLRYSEAWPLVHYLWCSQTFRQEMCTAIWERMSK